MMWSKLKRKLVNTFTKYNDLERQTSTKLELAKVNLCHESGKKIISDLTDKNRFKFETSTNMKSNHWEFFASISAKNDTSAYDRVLEIGTYDGKTTTVLATLFPNCEIMTIDLQDNDTSFKNSYNREHDVANFIDQRNRLLGGYSNIIPIRENSFSLTFLENVQFDLIWVDGAHGYPTITSDIINAYRLLKPNGFLLVDDVITENLVDSDATYLSVGAYETLKQLSQLGAFSDYSYPLKRVNVISGDKIINNKKIFVGKKTKLRDNSNAS